MPIEDFGIIEEKKEYGKRDLKKTKFLDLTTTAVVRILQDTYYSEETHYINKRTIRCLGDECPVCQNNKVIIMQNPETFRDDPRYNSKRKVFMVNVFDKSLVKECPSCKEENKANPTSMNCKKCSNILTSEAKPSNTVKVLSKGVTLFDHLKSINLAILDDKGEKVGLSNYDITLAVAGSGKDKTITPIPGQITAKPDFKEDDLFDLSKVVIELNPTEILDLQRGVSMSDIFAARKASKAEFVTKDFVTADSIQDVQSEVDKLFGNL